MTARGGVFHPGEHLPELRLRMLHYFGKCPHRTAWNAYRAKDFNPLGCRAATKYLLEDAFQRMPVLDS